MVRYVSDEVGVMYLGQLVELAEADEIYRHPLHPYTQGLLKAIPRLSTPHGQELYTIRGIVPDLSRLPEGCVFSNRCDQCREICLQKRPPLREMPDGRRVRCFLQEGGRIVE